MFEALSSRLEAVFRRLRGASRLSAGDVDQALAEVRTALLDADVSLDAAELFLAKVRARALGAEVTESLTPGQSVVRVVWDELRAMLGGKAAPLKLAPKPPTVVLLAGLQGSGKTTMAAKLAAMWRRQKKDVLLVACDTDRPAAVLQLQEMGQRVGAPVFTLAGKRPPEIAAAALESERAYTADFVVVDSAGRQQLDGALMDELRRVRDAAKPTHTWLVVDSMLGQESAQIAKAFHEAVPLSGLILTKLDGDARGGAALSMRAAVPAPIVFLSTGEKPEDLEPFHPDRLASRILGMGDVLTLIEKVQQHTQQKEAEKLAEKIRKADLTYGDFLEQILKVKQMGGIAEMMKMLPGMGAGAPPPGMAAPDEGEMKRTEAVIRSMTAGERDGRVDIGGSRRLRIAKGSGTRVEDVNRVMRQFEDTRKMMKSLSSRKHGRPPWMR